MTGVAMKLIGRRAMLLGGALALPAFGAVAATLKPRMFERLGWAGGTPGGDGGQVIRVTSLAGAGPGSFREAVTAKGPRTVVFDVAGVIDLARHSVKIVEPFLTIAGETAPSPGVTLIKGGSPSRPTT
jgi:hypothetical protein